MSLSATLAQSDVRPDTPENRNLERAFRGQHDLVALGRFDKFLVESPTTTSESLCHRVTCDIHVAGTCIVSVITEVLPGCDQTEVPATYVNGRQHHYRFYSFYSCKINTVNITIHVPGKVKENITGSQTQHFCCLKTTFIRITISCFVFRRLGIAQR